MKQWWTSSRPSCEIVPEQFQGSQGSEVGRAQILPPPGNCSSKPELKRRNCQASENRHRKTQGPGVNLMMVTEGPAHTGVELVSSLVGTPLTQCSYNPERGVCYPVPPQTPCKQSDHRTNLHQGTEGSRLCLTPTTFASSTCHHGQGHTKWAHGEDALPGEVSASGPALQHTLSLA